MQTRLGRQTITAVMTLTLDENGALSGTWLSHGLPMPLSDIRYQDGTLHFKRTVGDQTLVFKGTIEDQEITGTYDTNTGPLTVKGQRPVAAPPEPRRPALHEGPSLLDGTETTFVVVGQSASYTWPAILQDMLDKHAGKRLYHVQNAAVGGAPAGSWAGEPGDPYYEATFGTMMRDYFGEEALLGRDEQPDATIALCQQSLQRTETRMGPVRSSTDEHGIRIGADILEQLARQLHDAGIEHVVMSTHIYQQMSEPQIGNERFALRALLERGHDFILEGPDVWSMTISRFPGAYEQDQVHPNELGMKIIAAAWYQVLTGDEARQDIVENMFEQPYDLTEMTRQYLNWRAGNLEEPPTTVLRSN
jgi:hypothetical protein